MTAPLNASPLDPAPPLPRVATLACAYAACQALSGAGGPSSGPSAATERL